jgi:hypothetical protein
MDECSHGGDHDINISSCGLGIAQKLDELASVEIPEFLPNKLLRNAKAPVDSHNELRIESKD